MWSSQENEVKNAVFYSLPARPEKVPILGFDLRLTSDDAKNADFAPKNDKCPAVLPQGIYE
jgi:hypothetical protein